MPEKLSALTLASYTSPPCSCDPPIVTAVTSCISRRLNSLTYSASGVAVVAIFNYKIPAYLIDCSLTAQLQFDRHFSIKCNEIQINNKITQITEFHLNRLSIFSPLLSIFLISYHVILLECKEDTTIPLFSNYEVLIT